MAAGSGERGAGRGDKERSIDRIVPILAVRME